MFVAKVYTRREAAFRSTCNGVGLAEWNIKASIL